MNEGISVYSQATPLSGHADSLETAIESDNVLSFKELNSSAAGSSGDTVGLYYGQAGSIVTFLIETYGADKFGDLIKVFKDGSTPDKAFESVYGLDQLGIENAWRESVGLEARSASASPTPKATEEARAAATSPARTPDASSSGDDGGTPVVTIAIIIALAALLLAAVIGAGNGAPPPHVIDGWRDYTSATKQPAVFDTRNTPSRAMISSISARISRKIGARWLPSAGRSSIASMAKVP